MRKISARQILAKSKELAVAAEKPPG